MEEESPVGVLKEGDPHYTAVGRVASTWAFLEMLIDTKIRDLIDADDKAVACVTAQVIGPAPRLNALISLMRLRGVPASVVEEAESFSGRMQGLGTKRNRVVHDPLFGSVEGQVYAARTSAKGTLIYSFEPVSLQEMVNVAKQIDKAITDWLAIEFRIVPEAPEEVPEIE